MKKQFALASIEIVVFSFVFFLLLYHIPRAFYLLLILYFIGMALIGIQIYSKMIKPVIEVQKDLERAAEENARAETIRKEFVANVSHELKTPLTSISGFIETLQAGAAENPEIRTKFIDIIAIETSRLKRLIEDLLVLSDIENKKDTTDKEPICIKQAVEETITTLAPIAEQKQVRILTLYDKQASIYGSTDRFRQMLINLIENAIKYSNEGGRIWVSAKVIDGNTQVSVRDEGIGIDEEHLDRLFERFYRVDKSRSKKAGGTGLGLSIVKHIAALFEAELTVESREGEGTTFFITFKSE